MSAPISNIDACVKSGNRQKKTAISTHQQGQHKLLSTFGGGINIDENQQIQKKVKAQNF